MNGTKICAIRVRGRTGISREVKATLNMLRLYRNNYCVVLEPRKEILGMLNKCKDYITWGEIDNESFSELIKNKAEPYKGLLTDTKQKINYKKFLVIDNNKYKPFFRLKPPVKGFARKGIKTSFKQGGALGYRGEKINDLVRRMI